MVPVQDAVEHGVSHVQVGVVHVDLRPEHAGTVLELAGLHPPKEAEVLPDRPVAPRGLHPRRREGSPGLPYLLGRLVVHVGLARLDQLDGPVVELVKVVGREAELVPCEAEPGHVPLNGLHVLRLLFCRVRVVEAEVALPAELLRQAEVQTDGFGMADMEVSVRLRRKTGVHLLHDAPFEVVQYDLFNEVRAFARLDLHDAYAPLSAGRPVPGNIVTRTGRNVNDSVYASW